MLAGLSAGAICWFRHGNSDAPTIEGQATGAPKTMRVDGLGLVDATLCPHMNSEPYRRDEFPEMMRTTAGVGLGLDDGAAIEVLGDHYRILSVLPGAAAHRLQWRHETLMRHTLAADDGLRPLARLLGDDPSLLTHG